MSAFGVPLRGGVRSRAAGAALAAAGVAGLAAASLALRTTALGEGLWIDEGLSLAIAGRPLGELPGLLRADGSPLLFYVLLHGWMEAFGSGEEAVRSLSLACALATVPAALWAGWSLFGPRAGAVAALLAATNPFLTAYAQEARMYALVVLLGLLLAVAFLHAFARRRRAFVAPVALLLALLAHTHNWGLALGAGSLVALAGLLAAAPARERRGLGRDAALAYGAAALLYVPWVPTLLAQVAHTGAPWSNTPGAGELLDGVLVPLGGGVVGAAALVVALAGAGAARAGASRDRGPRRAPVPASARAPVPASARELLALLAIALATVGLAWTVSQFEPNWADRYLAVAAGPLLLAVAAGAARLGTPGLVAAVALASVWATDTGRRQHGNARELAAAVAADRRTLVVSAQPEQLAVLRRYVGPGPRYATTLGPATEPAMDWRDAVARLRAAHARPTLARMLAGARPGDRVVLVRPSIARPRNWRAPWTRLVRVRAAEWAAALDAHPRLRPGRTFTARATGGADVWAREWRVRAP